MKSISEVEHILSDVLTRRNENETFTTTTDSLVIITKLPVAPDDPTPIRIGVGLSINSDFDETVVLGSSLKIHVTYGNRALFETCLENLHQNAISSGNPVTVVGLDAGDKGDLWHFGFTSTHSFPCRHPVLGQTPLLIELMALALALHLDGVTAMFTAVLELIEGDDEEEAETASETPSLN